MSTDFPKLTLNQKLRRIRERFCLTHAGMAEELKARRLRSSPISAEMVAQFEIDDHAVPLLTLDAYSKYSGIPVSSLTDDEIQPFA